jgi:hypothetical protein
MTETTTASRLSPLLLCALLALSWGGTVGCKKDEPPPPLPAPASAAAPAPTTPIELVPEPIPTPSVSVSAAPKTGTGTASSLKKCCGALSQNAANAPEPNKTYMLQAAAVCNAAVGAGQASPAAIGAISAALRGAGMPTACK